MVEARPRPYDGLPPTQSAKSSHFIVWMPLYAETIIRIVHAKSQAAVLPVMAYRRSVAVPTTTAVISRQPISGIDKMDRARAVMIVLTRIAEKIIAPGIENASIHRIEKAV
jgi:hypothetical protein